MTTDAPPATGFLEVPVKTVHPASSQIRSEIGDLSDILPSIKEVGVQSPVTVRPHPDIPGEWLLVFGYRRHAATIEAKRKKIRIVVREDLSSDLDVLIAQWHENEGREDLPELDKARAMEQLALFGLTDGQIAKKLAAGTSADVKAKRKLLDLPDETKQVLQSPEVEVTTEEAAALHEFRDDIATQRKIIDAIDSGRVIDWVVTQARQDRDRAKERKATLDQLAAAGLTVLKSADYQKRLDTLGIRDVDAHAAGCPGHAVAVDTYANQTPVCREPARYHRLDGDPNRFLGSRVKDGKAEALTDKERAAFAAEQEAKERAKAEHKANIETAATLRAKFLVSRCRGAKPLPNRAAAERAIAAHLAWLLASDARLEVSVTQWGVLAGAPMTERSPSGGDYEWQRKAAESTREHVPTLDPHRALLGALASHHEKRLQQFVAWEPHNMRPGIEGQRWLSLLGDLGYSLSDWEREHLAAGAAYEPEPDDEDWDGEDDFAHDDGDLPSEVSPDAHAAAVAATSEPDEDGDPDDDAEDGQAAAGGDG